MSQPKETYTWYEGRKMLVFFVGSKPVLVLCGRLADKAQLQLSIKTLEEFLITNPDSGMNHEIITKKEALKQRLNSI